MSRDATLKPGERSHFELFALPERYAIDRDALERAYRRVQTTVHPDRFAGASDAQRRVAMQWATQANEAVRVLRDPIARAAYICARNGVDVGSESNTSMPADFLLEQMRWRESLDEARDGGDAAALAALRAEVQAAHSRTLSELAVAIDETRDFGAAAALTRRMMFIDRLARELGAEPAAGGSR